MEQDSRCSSPLLSDILSLVCGCLLVDDSSLNDVDDCLHKIRLIQYDKAGDANEIAHDMTYVFTHLFTPPCSVGGDDRRVVEQEELGHEHAFNSNNKQDG